MTDLEVLLQERKELQSKIKLLEKTSRETAIAQVKKIILDFSLEPYDIFDEIAIRVQPRYHDPLTGDQWSGRGKTPNWLKDKDRSLYEIKKPE